MVTPASAYACIRSAIRSDRAEQRGAVDELERHRGRRALLVAGQVLVLDLGGLLLVAHALRELVVEVLLAAAHAADVQRGVGAEQVGAAPRRSSPTRQRHGGHDVEAVQRLARLLPARAQVPERGVLERARRTKKIGSQPSAISPVSSRFFGPIAAR